MSGPLITERFFPERELVAKRRVRRRGAYSDFEGIFRYRRRPIRPVPHTLAELADSRHRSNEAVLDIVRRKTLCSDG